MTTKKHSTLRNVIITACNEKHGDFLTQHWLTSLKSNVNLTNIDIVILDYGLSKNQQKKLKDVCVIPGSASGHIVTARLKDIALFLEDSTYDQVLVCDGGDIIFQSDIHILFLQNTTNIRAVIEERNSLFNQLVSNKSYFDSRIAQEINAVTRLQPIINAGLYIGPREKIIEMLHFCYDHLEKKGFGQDQVIFNYYLYKNGFVSIPSDYNYAVSVNKRFIKIRNGKIYFRNGEIVPVVHNVGMDRFRKIKNFGYGAQYNQLKRFDYFISYGIIFVTDKIHSLFVWLHKNFIRK